jgi:hypothetical protein
MPQHHKHKGGKVLRTAGITALLPTHHTAKVPSRNQHHNQNTISHCDRTSPNHQTAMSHYNRTSPNHHTAMSHYDRTSPTHHTAISQCDRTSPNRQTAILHCDRNSTNQQISISYSLLGRTAASIPSKQEFPGRAIAQAVNRILLTPEVWDFAQVSPCCICGGQSGTGKGFSRSPSVFPCQYHYTAAHVSSWGRTDL